MPTRDIFAPLVSSRTLGRVLLYSVLTGIYAAVPAVLEYSRFSDVIDASSQFHAVLSLILGWLLVFRTNTAYSRWWEARTLWGALVNACRNLSLKVSALGTLTAEQRGLAQELIRSFPVALRCHLRGEVCELLPTEVQRRVGDAVHLPLAISQQIYALVGSGKLAGKIDGDELRVLDSEMLRLMDICGGCERILKTRIVKSYRVFARQCVFLFLITLPWGIADDFRIWAIPMTVISAYFMMGLETVAEHVEVPFGYDEDDLDLDGLCVTIASSVDEVFQSAGSGDQ